MAKLVIDKTDLFNLIKEKYGSDEITGIPEDIEVSIRIQDKKITNLTTIQEIPGCQPTTPNKGIMGTVRPDLPVF